MNLDSKRWLCCSWLRSLVFQWYAARADASGEFQRPFSRDWEELLKAAELISAESRQESFREATALQATGLVKLRTARYRPYQIERILIPFAAEQILRELFSDELPNPAEPRFDFTSVKLAPQLAFLTTEAPTVASNDLLKLNEFFLKENQSRCIVPIKERSLEIFGDEKRLDALLSTSLFRHGRLDWRNDLKCDIVGEPLGWKRGPAQASALPIIVIENAATWHSYCRWNSERKSFSAVVYGCGNRFADSILCLAEIFSELGGNRRTFYFGDVDPQGLIIPQVASERGRVAGLPPVEPHMWSYRQIFRLGSDRGQPWEGDAPIPSVCEWLGEFAEPARQLFSSNRRLAQELVGWEFLRNMEAAG